MNAASEELPAVKFLRGPEYHQATAEICRTTGLLATPKCAEAGAPCLNTPPTRKSPQIRCDVHGGGIRNYAREYGQEECGPRARLRQWIPRPSGRRCVLALNAAGPERCCL